MLGWRVRAAGTEDDERCERPACACCRRARTGAPEASRSGRTRGGVATLLIQLSRRSATLGHSNHMLLRFLPLLLLFCCRSMAGVSGTVSDISGASVSGATVDLRTPSGITVFRTNTSAEGRFEWADAPPGSYQLRVTGEGLEDREVPVRAPAADLQIVVQARSVYSRITVTTTRGAIESADQSPQISFAKDQHDIRKRPIATLGEALAAEPGVLVQQSTFAQVSPFLRGLTGYQVLNLVDGIRFNNSTFRSGPNQYLAYVEPHQAERIEALLGPASVQ